MPYDLSAIRNKMKQASGRRSDPDEFRPEKAKAQEKHRYRFFVLPGVMEGDKLKSGVAQSSMDIFFTSHGQHWIQNSPHVCPRVNDGNDCELCSFGLNLLRNKSLGEQERQSIRSEWLPNSNYVVNIYFPNWKNNPEELRGRVMYYKAPKTVFDIWTACIERDPSDISMSDDEDDEVEASGVFFDESNAWLFELQVELQGKSNSYKTSRFVGKSATPIVRNDDGTADKKAIAQILASRIDIPSRLEKADPDKIRKLANSLIHGDDEDDDAMSIDVTEEEAPAPVRKAQKVKAEPQREPEPEPAPKKKEAAQAELWDDDDISSEVDSILGNIDDD